MQGEREKNVVTKQKVEVVEVVKPEPKPEEPQEVVAPVKEMNYYLVAGCFEFKSNAERLQAELQKEGYDSQILPFYHLSMVTYNGYETRQEAQKALNRMVNDPDKEMAWVYPVH